MKKKLILLLTVIFCFSAAATTLCSERIIAYPNQNKIYVYDNGDFKIASGLNIYSINNENYFKLRDICNLVDAKIEYNSKSDEIYVFSDTKADNSQKSDTPSFFDKNPKYPKQAEKGFYVNGKKLNNLLAYNIDGYNYFKLREVAKAINFSCIWDEVAKIVVLDKSIGYDEGINNSVTLNRIEKIIEPIKEQGISYKVLDENKYTYVPGSKDYTMIEKCIRENINECFDLTFFALPQEETYMDFVWNGDCDVRILDFKLRGNWNVLENFGYRVYVLNGVVKVVEFIGEENFNFFISKIKNTVSNKELIQKAIELDHIKDEIDEIRVLRSFNRETADFDGDVEIAYIDNGGHYFATLNTFPSSKQVIPK
ncbi:MAG: hypothetical protein PHX08_05795 [Lachnospiraceae bacterium]|nr:hypothetical protein [Lachnospiraceae bacterium]